MKEMKLEELKVKTPAELLSFAEESGVENASTMRKQELMFATLKELADKEIEIIGTGVVEVLQDGFGFLRSPDANYLPGPDDIYVSPSQIRRFALRSGDTVEGQIRSPKEGERYFALLKVSQINFADPEATKHKVHFDIEVSIAYLDGQVRAGADALQIFDTWAGCLPDDQFEAWVILPTKRIVAELKQRHPQVPIIGFPRGAGATAGWYLQETKVETVWAYNDPHGFNQLIDLLVEVSIAYLDGQVRAGADALQIFDTWAGCLPDDQFEAWVILPTKRIVAELKQRHPQVPIIGFPRGAGATAGWYLQETKVEGLGCDTAMSLVLMRELAGIGAVVQGNLDPLLLLAGGTHMEIRVKQILDAMNTVPFIFNLGHGIVPETPPENVARLVALVRGEGV